MSKVHAARFAGYDFRLAFLRQAMETYGPPCGSYPNDPRTTHRDEEVTCKRCLKMLAPGPEEGAER